jgi:hypothetical protein
VAVRDAASCAGRPHGIYLCLFSVRATLCVLNRLHEVLDRDLSSRSGRESLAGAT